MALTLRTENETRLPDGGSLEISVAGKRSIDTGGFLLRLMGA